MTHITQSFEFALPSSIYRLDAEGDVVIHPYHVPSVDYVLGNAGLLALVQVVEGDDLAWHFIPRYS